MPNYLVIFFFSSKTEETAIIFRLNIIRRVLNVLPNYQVLGEIFSCGYFLWIVWEKKESFLREKNPKNFYATSNLFFCEVA